MPEFKKPHALTDAPLHYCPGCTHGIVHRLVAEAIDSGKISKEDLVTVSENAASMGGSQVYLEPGEQMSVHDMLKTVAVVSANDGSVALAEHLAGSEQAFVDMMNERAKQLGMNDTTFKNSHGIDEDGHVTSAYDISLMSRELLQNHPNNYELFVMYGKNAYRKTRYAEGDKAFAHAKELKKSGALWFKKCICKTEEILFLI